MTRDEHLKWAQTRALEYLDAGDLREAFMSMLSDLNKHDELASHLGGKLGMMLQMSGQLDRPDQLRSWIEGFR